MNLTTIAAACVAATTTIAGAQTMPKAPDFLKKGDTIAVMSLASTPKSEYVDATTNVLKQWGFNVVVSPLALAKEKLYAGTADQRTAELLKYLRDPKVKAIFSSRGGYGSAQILSRISPDTLAKYPKWIIGYSDITSIHSAQLCAGNMSIHASMGSKMLSGGPENEINIMLLNTLKGKLPKYKVPGHEYNLPGKAHGIIMGGNLSLIDKIAGSRRYDCLHEDNIPKDIILFIEDVGEDFFGVNGMLDHLYLSGAMKNVRGLIVGRFTDYKPVSEYKDMNELIIETVTALNKVYGYDFPICFDFPVGHDEEWNYPIVEGHKVTLNVTKHKVTLTYDK